MEIQFEPGEYTGTVTGQMFGKSKTGTDYFAVSFEVQGATRWVFLYLTDKARDMTEAALEVLGYTSGGFEYLEPSTPGYCSLSGREVPLVCKHQTYNGQLQEKWGIVTSREPRAADVGSLKQLNALFNRAGKPKSAKPSQVERPVPAAAEAAGSDDIPF